MILLFHLHKVHKGVIVSRYAHKTIKFRVNLFAERNQAWNMLPSPREYTQKPEVEYSEAHTISSQAVLRRRGTGDYMAKMHDEVRDGQAFPIVVKPRNRSHRKSFETVAVFNDTMMSGKMFSVERTAFCHLHVS